MKDEKRIRTFLSEMKEVYPDLFKMMVFWDLLGFSEITFMSDLLSAIHHAGSFSDYGRVTIDIRGGKIVKLDATSSRLPLKDALLFKKKIFKK